MNDDEHEAFGAMIHAMTPRNHHREIADDRDRLLRENIAGSALNAQMAKQLSDLRTEVERLTREKQLIIESSAAAINEADERAEAERLTRERDNAITKCYELEDQVSDQTVKAKTAERQVAMLREALDLFVSYGCPVCHGDCASANPPVSLCPMQAARAALAKAKS